MKTTWKLVPGLALALVSMVPAVGFASPRWVPVSPGGGAVAEVVRSPSSPEIVYAASYLFNDLYRSEDGAASWRRVGRWIGRSLQIAPDDPSTVYALDFSRQLQRTRDGGGSWVRIGRLSGVYGYTTEAQHPQRLLAATGDGLYRSEDFGDHWTEIAFPHQLLIAVASDPKDDRRILVLSARGDLTVSRSTDGGATWTSAPLTVFGFQIDPAPHFVFDAAHSDTAYLYEDKVARSTDGGATWEQPSTTEVRKLISTADGRLLATTTFGDILSSTDRADTWQSNDLRNPRDFLYDLAASKAAPDSLLAAGSQGIWRSGDAGTTWKNRSRGIPVLDISSIGVAPLGAQEVVAVGGGRVFRSPDRGATWQRVHSALNDLEPFSITFDPQRPERIYGIGFDGRADALQRSDDRGQTWPRLPFPYGCNSSSAPACEVHFSAFTVDPSHSETLYAAGGYFYPHVNHGGFFLRSRDAGATWESLPELNDSVGEVFVDPRRSEVLYALAGRRLYKSEDGAQTWRIVGKGLPPLTKRTIEIDPQNSQRIYAGTGRGVFVSEDGGVTFRAMNSGIEHRRIDEILIDPNHPNRLYASAPQVGVFRWNPSTRHWTPLNDGLPTGKFYGVLALDPRDPNTLYAGTYGSGVLRLDQ